MRPLLSLLAIALAASTALLHQARCGLDGFDHPAQCGTSDGRIAVFDIEDAQVAAALAIGFALLSTLPNATAASCP